MTACEVISQKTMRLIILSSILCLACCGGGRQYLDYSLEFSSLAAGQPALKISARAGVERIYLNFFAPDCPPCIKEVPALHAFYKKIADNQKVAFYGIGSDLEALAADKAMNDEQVRPAAQSFTTDYKLPYPIYLAGTTKLKKFRVTGFPETFIFKRTEKGWRLQKKFISDVTEKDLTAFLP